MLVIRLARRCARHVDAAIAQVRDRLRIAQPGHAHAHDEGGRVLGRVHDGAGNKAREISADLRAQCAHMREGFLMFGLRQLDGTRETRSEEHRLRARAKPVLLPTAECVCVHLHTVTHVQRADTARPADLVRGDGRQLGVPLARFRGERLGGIDVVERVGGELVAHAADLCRGEDVAHFVLHVHDSDERCRAFRERIAQLPQVKLAIDSIDVGNWPIHFPAHTAHASRDRRMLERRGDNLGRIVAARRAHATDGKVVRFGSPRSKVHLARLDPERAGNGSTTLFEDFLRAHSHGMSRRGVSPCIAYHLVHALDDLGTRRRGRRVVEVAFSYMAHSGFIHLFVLVLVSLPCDTP